MSHLCLFWNVGICSLCLCKDRNTTTLLTFGIEPLILDPGHEVCSCLDDRLNMKNLVKMKNYVPAISFVAHVHHLWLLLWKIHRTSWRVGRPLSTVLLHRPELEQQKAEPGWRQVGGGGGWGAGETVEPPEGSLSEPGSLML